MKKQCLSIFFFCFLTVSFGQNCRSANLTVQANGAKANFGAGGFLNFTDFDYAFSPFYKNRSSPSSIFATNLWFIGKSGSTQKLSFDTYSNLRLVSGPINDVTRTTDFVDCGKWDKFWTVRRYEIEAHQRDFADNGRIDNPIANIMAWPAVGNPNSLQINGFALPSRINGRSYAPFKDVNNDGIYNPMQGDFPAISATSVISPEIITWCIFNDLNARAPLNLEIQTTSYGYECNDTAQVLNNTLFSSFKIIHHGTTDLDSFKIGMFADFDIGCYSDDYAGCDSILHTFFGYNAKPNLDGASGNVCNQGVSTFKGSIPVQAITFLNQPMTRFMIFNSASQGNPLSPTTDPQTISDFVNYFNGKWKDGKPITSGGIGYNTVGNSTNYMYPSDPYDSSATAWSMARAQTPAVYDARALGITEMNKISAGETKTLDFSYSAHRRTGRNAWQNVATMREEVAKIRQFYQTPTAALLCPRPPICETTDCVWAGDANKDGIANYKDLLPVGVAQTRNGQPRNGNIVWSPKTVTNWNSTFSDGNFNTKHIDCDGNGTKPDFQRPIDVYTEGSSLAMTFDRDPDNLTFSLQNNYNFTAKVNLAPTPDIYGIAFEVEYDPYFLQLMGQVYDIVPMNQNLIASMTDSSKLNANKAQIEFSRLGFAANATNNEAILTFKLGVNETNRYWATNTTFIKFKNIKGIKRDGTIIPLGGTKQRVRFTDILIIDNKEINAEKIAIYPNPTTNQTTVNWGKLPIKRLQLSNAMGQILMEKNIAESAESDVLSLQNFPTGVYFLQIQTVENKIAVRKLILTR
jgi:hypothetical protein